MENRNKLPDWLVEVIERTRDEYDKGKSDYSITSLIQPPMINELRRRHNPPEDVSDQLQAFVGTAAHNQIERMLKGNPRYIVEERFFHTFHVPEAPGEQKEFIVSAQIDLFDKETGQLWDHKFSKLYSFVNKKEEHEIQLAFQAFLLKKRGHEVKSVQISGFPLDWTKTSSVRDSKVPDMMFCHTPYPQWDDADVDAYIKERIIQMEYAKLGQIRLCDESERWSKPTQYKVKKEGRKTALRVLNTREEAEEYIKNIDKPSGKEYIEEVKGEDTRCIYFCPVKEYCSYYKETYGKEN